MRDLSRVAALLAFTVVLAVSAAEYKVGDGVEGKWGNFWTPGTIAAVEGNRYKVHYTNYGDAFDAWLTADAIRPPQTGAKDTAKARIDEMNAAGKPRTDTAGTGAAGTAAAATAAATKPSTTAYAAGTGVEINWHGGWYPGKVTEVKGYSYKVRYDNSGENFDEWVGADRLKPDPRAAQAPAEPVGAVAGGERVEALDLNTKWVAATVLKKDGAKVLVRFDGQSDIWDKWETPDRIRPIGTTGALALQHPAPAQAGSKGLKGWVVGTRPLNGRYDCLFYWFQEDGRLFMSDRMPKGWAELTFDAVQKADPSHCGTYGFGGGRMTVQMNGGAPDTLGFGAEVIGNRLREPAWNFAAGRKFEGGFSVDSAGSAGGVTAIASDSWRFHADGTFKRTKVVGVMTNDSKNAKDPHPGKATANGSDVTEGRYEFNGDHLLLTAAGGQRQTLGYFAIGSPKNPSMLGIEDVQYKANVDNQPAE